MFVCNYDRKMIVVDHRKRCVEIAKDCLGIEIADKCLGFLQTKHLQCSWDHIVKIGDFQKCKIHSSSLRDIRITACQSWWNSQKVKKSTVLIDGAVFIWRYAI